MRLVVLCCGFLVALAGCGPASGPGSSPSSAGGSSTPSSGSSGTTGTVPPPPATEPTASGVEYTVTYPFGVPSSTVSIKHTVNPPPLPYLVGIYAADHPEGSPAYQRISFYFRVGFPSYNFGYVKEVLNEGQGAPIPLPGNAFLRVGFTDAQAHSDSGGSTVVASPKNPMSFKNLRSYGFAGDFEGHLTYGLGIQVASGSDQVLKIRAGELKKPDGAGGFFYVVHFDVQTG